MHQHLLAWMGLFAWVGSGLARAAEPAPKTTAKVEALITAYRNTTNVEARLKTVRALKPWRSPAVDQFLEEEFSKLDGRHEADARLAGGVLQVWADKPTKDVLPYLIYEGLFHEDPAVVRACAAGIAQMPQDTKGLLSTGRSRRGQGVGEELAADLIQRMNERSELSHAMEKVLVIWAGKQREGYRPNVNLKSVPKVTERAAALTYWQGWYEEKFQKKLKL